MLKQLALNRDRDVRHAEVIDVADYIGRQGTHGSATNVLVVLIQQSSLYRATLASKEFRDWHGKRKTGRQR